jgi:hypothetical protein
VVVVVVDAGEASDYVAMKGGWLWGCLLHWCLLVPVAFFIATQFVVIAYSSAAEGCTVGIHVYTFGACLVRALTPTVLPCLWACPFHPQAAGRRVSFYSFAHVLAMDMQFHLDRKTGGFGWEDMGLMG